MRTHLLAAVAVVCTTVAACSAGIAGAPSPAPPVQTPQAASGPTAAAAPVSTDEPAATVPPEQVSTADYKTLAAALYKERAGIETEMETIANENAPPATRVQQINTELLPALRHLLGEAQAIQPEDAPAANLHQHLIASLQTTIAAYSDFATGFSQNDAAALARGRSELNAETQDLTIWVKGVPSL
jgi:hypothetical protein